MSAPHDHWHHADFAIGDPAHLVFEVAPRHGRRLTEVAGHSLTLSVTVACHLTIVPAAGTSETTLVHAGVSAPGPLVT